MLKNIPYLKSSQNWRKFYHLAFLTKDKWKYQCYTVYDLIFKLKHGHKNGKVNILVVENIVPSIIQSSQFIYYDSA